MGNAVAGGSAKYDLSDIVSVAETSPAGVGWDKAAVAAAGPPGIAPGGPALAYASLSHPTFPQQKLHELLRSFGKEAALEQVP